MKKIRIEGIKLSEELFQLNILRHFHSKDTLRHFCRILASNKINIPFLSTAYFGEEVQLVCCMSAEQKAKVQDLINAEASLGGCVEFIPSTGLLSVYPHKSDVRVLGLSLFALGRARIPIHGLASSLSALTLVTDYGRLDEAAEVLQEYLELPPGQRPFRPQFRITQSEIVKGK